VAVPLFGSGEDGLYAILLAISLELITCLFRFGLQKKSTVSTAFVGKLTGGLRVHHAYIGLVLVFTRNCLPTPVLAHAAVWVGWGCVLSDCAHHFWVLSEAGAHEFDLVYPSNSFPRLELFQGYLRDSFAFLMLGVCGTTLLLATLGFTYVE